MAVKPVARKLLGPKAAPRKIPAAAAKAASQKILAAAAKAAAVKTGLKHFRPKKAIHKSYPISYAGKRIAWAPGRREMVASSTSIQRVRSLALRAGYPQVILERVPRNLEPLLDKPDS